MQCKFFKGEFIAALFWTAMTSDAVDSYRCIVEIYCYHLHHRPSLKSILMRFYHLQGDSWGKANILGGDSIGYCEQKVHMNKCLINGYQYRAVCSSRHNFVTSLYVWLIKERSLQKKDGYTRRTARPPFWMLLPAQRFVTISSYKQHAILAHELQSALRLTVGFLEVYCKLWGLG